MEESKVTEEWRISYNYPEYGVSSEGRIRDSEECIIPQGVDKYGNSVIVVDHISINVSRLVACAFLPVQDSQIENFRRQMKELFSKEASENFIDCVNAIIEDIGENPTVDELLTLAEEMVKDYPNKCF